MLVETRRNWAPPTEQALIKMIPDTKTEALTLLTEECAEVIQAISKISRFGADTINSETGISNNAALRKELADLLATIRLATEHGAIQLPDEEMIEMSIKRKRSFSNL
jgi:NTP pyrophosphatase (non-canonical NTP hydrolase)